MKTKRQIKKKEQWKRNKENIEKSEKNSNGDRSKERHGKGERGGGQCCQSPSAKIHKGHSHTFSVAVLPFSTFPKASLTRGVDIVAV